MTPTSEYLKRPLRSEDEARRDVEAKRRFNSAVGFCLMHGLYMQDGPSPCPICNKEEDRG